jgi:hypothetical protein
VRGTAGAGVSFDEAQAKLTEFVDRVDGLGGIIGCSTLLLDVQRSVSAYLTHRAAHVHEALVELFGIADMETLDQLGGLALPAPVLSRCEGSVWALALL